MSRYCYHIASVRARGNRDSTVTTCTSLELMRHFGRQNQVGFSLQIQSVLNALLFAASVFQVPFMRLSKSRSTPLTFQRKNTATYSGGAYYS